LPLARMYPLTFSKGILTEIIGGLADRN